MRLDIRRYLSAVLLGGALCWSSMPLCAYEPQEERAIFLLGDGLEFQYDQIRLMSMQEESVQPLDPGAQQPLDLGSTQPLDFDAIFNEGPSFGNTQALDNLIQSLTPAPGAGGIGAGEIQTSSAIDLGSMLQQSDNIQTIGAQRRSQVAFDPRIRAYRYGQIYAQAEGQYFLPVRLDLDSMVNKIDPSLINAVTITPGPYGVTMGPGFAFIDIDLIDTPRYLDFPQQHGRAGFDFRANGGQTAERITAMGGGSDYGYILHYGYMKGSNYVAGNGMSIPSSYQSQNVLLQFGFDWNANTKTEIRFNHLNMGDTEYALQFFDISSLKTSALNVITTTVDPYDGSVWTNQLWTNATDFRGNNASSGKAEVRARIAGALNQNFLDDPQYGVNPGFTQAHINANVAGDLGSHGFRSMKTWGDNTGEQLTIGVDMRYIAQSTQENFNIGDPGGVLDPDQEIFQTNQPRSVMIDPGIFAQVSAPWTSFLRVTAGARLDWVHTYRAENLPLNNQTVLNDFSNEQNDHLFAGFLAGDIDLSQNWKARVGVGYAERVPNLVDRYSDGIYISMTQSGFSRVVGRPSLDKEQVVQIDASISGEYEYGTFRMSAFHSWIHDYNTYAALFVEPLSGARFLVAHNTGLATLKGCEMYSDYSVTENLVLFGTLQYVEGTDETISQPLPGIYPLESRLGLRILDDNQGETWGIEWGWRIVDAQNRIGILRDNLFDLPSYTPVEERTGGFATAYIKGYYNYSENLHFIAGIDNLFDRNYVEHLDNRLGGSPNPPDPAGFGPAAAFAPGFTAYGGVEYSW